MHTHHSTQTAVSATQQRAEASERIHSEQRSAAARSLCLQLHCPSLVTLAHSSLSLACFPAHLWEAAVACYARYRPCAPPLLCDVFGHPVRLPSRGPRGSSSHQYGRTTGQQAEQQTASD